MRRRRMVGGPAVWRTKQWAVGGLAALAAAAAAAPMSGGMSRVATAASVGHRAPDAGSTSLSNPMAVAVARSGPARGTLYIADTGNNRILAVSLSGTTSVAPTSALNYPQGLAVDGSGNLFIADHGSGRVLEEPAGGGPERVVADMGQTAEGVGLSPTSLAVDAQGTLYIIDFDRSHLIKESGGVVTNISSPQLNEPYGIATDFQGHFFISEDADGGVGIDSQGRLSFTQTGGVVQPASADGQLSPPLIQGLNHPAGLATDGQHVYIADLNNNRVLKVPVGGGASVEVGSGLRFP